MEIEHSSVDAVKPVLRRRNALGLDKPTIVPQRVYVPRDVGIQPIWLQPQSGELSTIEVGDSNIQSQMVSFADQTPSWKVDVQGEPDMSFGVADRDNEELGKFFERPFRIFNQAWTTTAGTFSVKFNPWKLFCENPRVLNRLVNYNMMRCKLHLKFVINGNGFHYGRVIASYTPLAQFDGTEPSRAHLAEDIVRMSQRPHVYLDPTTSLGGEMVLPFFYYKNALTIPDAEWDNMGEIHMAAINALKHANGATDEVRISVFAWVEDLVLSTPTSKTPSVLMPQSGEDEYGRKFSGAATSVAKALGKLSNIPTIGLYARASQMAVSAVGDIAAMFGYSRPVMDAPIVPFVPHYAGNMANTNVPDSSVKMTTDIKQEVIIDPRTVGLNGVDEMNIRSIATRESFIGKFNWAMLATSGTRLCTIGVTPCNYRTVVNGSQTEVHMTPAAHVASMFENWRGSMKYRFQVVGSNFHKGRLQIKYDPYDSSDNEINTAYTRIVDISEEKDFTIEVGWGVAYPYLKVNDLLDDLSINFSDSTLARQRFLHNGQLSVWVLNDLAVPNTTVTNDVEINVFVSCCEDIEFTNPTDSLYKKFSWFPTNAPTEVLEAQGGEESPEDPLVAPDHEHTPEPSKPSDIESAVTMAGKTQLVNPLSGICFGESIESVRSLMKRYVYYMSVAVPTGNNDRVSYTRSSPNFPLHRGFAANGIHSAFPTPGNRKYNYVRMTPMTWMAPCYAARKGGVRRKMVSYNTMLGGQGGKYDGGIQVVERAATTDVPYSEVTSVNQAATTKGTYAYNANIHAPNGLSGVHLQPIRNNPVMEFEMPYHIPERFIPSRIMEPNAPAFTGFQNWWKLLAYTNRDTNGSIYWQEYVAAADDFALMFYANVPILYADEVDPLPTNGT